MLGREPTFTELGIVSALWSEHCSYKHSRPLLKTLPTKAPYVLQGPGENAGVISIGDGLAVAFKIESHNHPSAVEPYQGAATGVGGILRDVFTMGARPIAMLNSLRFGSLDSRARALPVRRRREGHRRLRQLRRHSDRRRRGRVRSGVRGQSARQRDVRRPAARGRADSRRGRRASAIRSSPSARARAATAFTARRSRRRISPKQSDAKRPRVQVGDPFTEKLLLEASLELIRSGAHRRHSGHGRGGPHVVVGRDGGARRRRRHDRHDEGAGARRRA